MKQKFPKRKTKVLAVENKCFLGRNHLLRYSNSDDPGKEYIKNDRY